MSRFAEGLVPGGARIERQRLRLGQVRPPFGIELGIFDDANNQLPEDGAAQGNLYCRGFGSNRAALADPYLRPVAGEAFVKASWISFSSSLIGSQVP